MTGRKSDAVLRREGMADAAVLLTAKRVIPTLSVREWGDRLGLSPIEVQDAVAWFKALSPVHQRAKARKPAKARRKADDLKPGDPGFQPRAEQTCPDCGKVCRDRRGFAAHVRTVHIPATCDVCGLETTAGGLGPHKRSKHRSAP